MSNKAKELEGDRLVKEGESILTRWFWADPLAASIEFEKAANIYRAHSFFEKAKQTFIRAAEAKYTAKSTYHAAKNMEAAANIAVKELNQTAEGLALYRKAVNFHKESGSGEQAGQTLIVAAKLLQADAPVDALPLFKEALDLYSVDNAEIYGMENFRAAVGCAVRAQLYGEAIELQNRLIQVYQEQSKSNEFNKAVLGLMVLFLANADYVGGDKRYNELVVSGMAGFPSSEEARLAAQLLDSYERQDEEELKNTVAKQTFNFLDNQVARLAKSLKIESTAALV